MNAIQSAESSGVLVKPDVARLQMDAETAKPMTSGSATASTLGRSQCWARLCPCDTIDVDLVRRA